MKELTNVYFLFHHHGKVLEMTEGEYQKLANEVSQQWEDEDISLGRLYMPVLPDGMLDVKRNGGAIFFDQNDHFDNVGAGFDTNDIISEILGDIIYGPCFVQAYEEELDNIRSNYTSMR